MTTSTDRPSQEQADVPHAAEHKTGPTERLMQGVRLFGGVATAAGITLGVADLAADGHVHLVMPSVGCFVLAGLAANNLVNYHLICDRQEFYRRGQLDGWMKGWRGQPPDVDDPLLH